MSFTFGSSFGSTSTTTTPSFGFGSSTSTTRAFGQPSFGFGSSTAPATTGTTFAFGSGTAPGGTSFGGFGSAFGSTTATTTAPTFSFTTPVTTTQSLFSGFGQTQQSTSGFGSTLGVARPFGTGTGSAFSGFGSGTGSAFGTTTTGTLGGFGQQQQQPQQQQQQIPPGPHDALLNSIFNVNIYGDERDQVIMKWNLLQAVWGFGKGYYAQNAPPMEYDSQSILCRLKGIAYSVKPTASQSDALVAICLNKNAEEIRSQQIQFESSVSQILGNKPNITVHVDCVRQCLDNKSLVLIYVQEKLQNGTTKRVPNNEIYSYLIQPTPKQQLVSMGVDNVYCFTSPKDEQLTDYLENPPAGIDVKVWKQAQVDNPDPSKYVPVPLVGFNDVKWRFKCLDSESKIHETLLLQLSEKISALQRQQITSEAKLRQYKQNLLQLEHRILKVYVILSQSPNAAFGPEEEAIKAKLQNLHAALNKPQYFKNRILEIVSKLCLQENSVKKSENVMNEETFLNIKEFLAMQYKAINHLRELVYKDIADVNAIEEEVKKFPPLR